MLKPTYVKINVCNIFMKTNPGGQIDHRNVIGRDELIKEIWEVLEQQSVIMTAERRIGKTTVMTKMRAEPLEGWIPVFQDLEGFTSAAGFAMSVYKAVQQHLSTKRKITRRTNELLKGLGGAEIGGFITLPEQASAKWQDVLTRSIEDLVAEQPEGSRLLFLWDEVPFMLANIRDQEGEETAMQILNVLRSLRQTYRGFRMLMTGSIGLHHVLTSFAQRASASAAVNDMYSIDVTPLDLIYARDLAATLLRGEKIDVDIDTTAQEIAQISDGFAFYIHHIVRELKRRGSVRPGSVQSTIEEQLTDVDDPWELRHYKDRLADYYAQDRTTVLYLLDELAVHEEPLTARTLLSHLQTVGDYGDLEHIQDLLVKLARDHYLVRGRKGYSFRFSLIKRWWRLERELESA